MEAKNYPSYEELDEEGKAKFWLMVESQVWVFQGNGTFVISWVQNGSHNQYRGNWTMDEKGSKLSITVQGNSSAFQAEFKEAGLILQGGPDPTNNFFDVFHLQSLYQ